MVEFEAHDYISACAKDSKAELEAFETRLHTDFRKVFTEDLGVFLPNGYSTGYGD